MKRMILVLFTLFFVTFVCAPALVGQTSYGSINGTISDASQAAIPGAQVTLTNTETGVTTIRETNATGVYLFVNIPPGSYKLSVTAEGFSTAEETPFIVSVNDSLTHNISLAVGAVTETIEVTAEAALLQQTTSELGTVISEAQVRDLPLNGRNFSQLLTLTPGATPVSTAQGSGGGTGFNAPVALPGSAFTLPSINGAWNRTNMYMLDGIVNHWFFGASWAVLPIVDAVQEFKVQSHNDKAEYGGVLGGVMNVVSKSGTNEYHGSGWWFVRNDAFDARNPFTDATSDGPTPFRQNQFGAEIGGPIIKNKTFFHFAYEGWRFSRSAQNTYFHPTDAELSGDFSNALLQQVIYDPASTRADPNASTGFVRTPFPGNRVDRIDQMALNFMTNYLDRPNISNPDFNVINSRPQISDSDTFTVKADHRFSDTDSVWFRFSSMTNPQDIPNTLKNGQLFENKPRNVAGGWIHLLGSNVVFDTKFGWVREALNQDLKSTVGLEPLAADGWVGVEAYGAPNFGLQSPYNGSGFTFPRPETDWQWMFSEGVSWIKGNHNIKFGGTYIFQKRDALTTQHDVPFNNAQTADPNNPGTTGNSVASALLGLPAQYTIRNQKYIARWPSWGMYFQDEWKVTPRLTLNLGLRYDTFNIAKLDPGMNNGFNWATGDWVIGGGSLPRPCSETGIAPCIPGSGDLSDVPGGDHIRVNQYENLYRSPRDGFQPRLGIAWRLADKTVLRAGYGVTFDTYSGIMQTFQQSIGTWPDKQFAQPAYNGVNDPLVSVGQANQLGGNPLPDPSPFGSAGWYADPEFDNAYAHQWNVEIQQQLSNDLTLSTAYVGSRTLRLEHNGAANTATTPGPGTPDEVLARRPYPYQTTMFYSLFDNKAWYDSLQVKLDKRFSKGFQALISYTWSKALDHQSGWYAAENGIGGSAALSDWYNPDSSKGPAGYNIPHFLSIAGIYELPFGRDKQWLNNGVGAILLGGWQLNMIAQFRSGQPANIVVTGDVANIGNEVAWWNYSRPNLVGDPKVSNPTQERWFNTDAFATPNFEYGNAGKNIVYTDSVPNIDFSLFKQFAITERYSVELRIETFNTFNIMALGGPDVTLGNSTFGRVSGLAQGKQPRIIQFGLKFHF